MLNLGHSVTRNYLRIICCICRIRELHFSELVKRLCHLSAARRQIGILVSEKLNLVREKSGKSQGILFLHESGHTDYSS